MDLRGCYTALVTPFRDGSVDETALQALVEAQIAAGIDGLVPVGTTGESPTLDFEEHERVIDIVVEAAAGRCPVIAGTGGNSTSEAVRLTRHARKAGADASLQVCPYYNKPSQEGLYRHYSAVADEGGLPVVLYNVPGRSGAEIAVSTVARLSANPRVVAVKEAGQSVDRVSAILDACDITVVSGDDSLTLPMMAVGGRGVISVISNLLPAEMVSLVHAALAGDWTQAQSIHRRMYPLFKGLFVETNPIPVKAALAMLGRIQEEYRLPLCTMSEANRQALRDNMAKAGIRL
jgi:4-hydroxy-tetrahydrodipicolinate synthase